jgi:flagellar hook assembly protein FlgD
MNNEEKIMLTWENENKKTFITNDLTKEERDIREEANAEKENGNKVRIGYKKLTINKKILTWKPKDLKIQKTR